MGLQKIYALNMTHWIGELGPECQIEKMIGPNSVIVPHEKMERVIRALMKC